MNTDIRRLHDSASLQLFLKLAIKCSDVGHAVKKWEMHDLWSQRVVQVVGAVSEPLDDACTHGASLCRSSTSRATLRSIWGSSRSRS